MQSEEENGVVDHYILNYLENLDIERGKKIFNKKKIYIWGACENGEYVERFLKLGGVEIAGFIDTYCQIEEYDGLPVFRPCQMLNKTNYFIVIALRRKREILDWISSNSLVEYEDYVYPIMHVFQISCTNLTGRYEDINGNVIELLDEKIACTICLCGKGNYVKIGGGFHAESGVVLRAEFGSSIIIGDYADLGRDVEIKVTQRGSFACGERFEIGEKTKIGVNEANVLIRDHFTCQEYCNIMALHNPLNIGNDCMFSNHVTIMSSSGHAIVDMERNEIVREREVNMGNHVWIGAYATILSRANVQEGSIVGANSVVKTCVGENSVAVGNPVRIIKQNHTWKRHP